MQEERGRATINTLLTGERMKALQTLRYRTIQVIRGRRFLREGRRGVPIAGAVAPGARNVHVAAIG